MKAKGVIKQVLEDRTWDEFPDEPITGIYVSIVGDPASGIPNRDYRISDLHLDPSSFSEGDWAPMLAEIKDKVVELFNLLDGDGEPVVYFETASGGAPPGEEGPVEPEPLELEPSLDKDAAIHPGVEQDEVPLPPASPSVESKDANRIRNLLDEGQTVIVEVKKKSLSQRTRPRNAPKEGSAAAAGLYDKMGPDAYHAWRAKLKRQKKK